MMASASELIYFVELANTLNFSRAAEHIGIAQPSLSAAIKRLENYIGTPLFVRHKTGVQLTPAGKRLLLHAKQLLQLWNTARTESLASHNEVQGCFSLGCHSSVGRYFLPTFLPALFEKYPKLELHIKHDLSRKILEEVINLSIDVGIIVNPVRHPDLIIQKLYDDKVGFWCGKSIATHLNAYLKTGNAVILCDPDLMQSQWLMKKLNAEKIKYRIVTSSSLEVIASLTSAGAGIGIMPTSVATSIDAKLKMIAKLPVYQDEIFLVYRHENRYVKAIQTMVEAIKRHWVGERS